MPSYEYICEVNDIEFEEFHSIMIVIEECPICKEKQLENHKPKRLISGGSGRGVVKLTGNDLTAKIKEDTNALRKQVYGNVNQYASVLGEDKYQKIQTRLDKNNKR